MWRQPRSVQTTIPCKECGTPLKAERSCRRVTLSCMKCQKSIDVTLVMEHMDQALEDFLGQVPCDRL